MILAVHDINITENELLAEVKKIYPKNFKNIWNPTIAKLAQKYGIPTTLIADWPLLKPQNLAKATSEYLNNPANFNHKEYENNDDQDALPEPLPLAYSEMFEALNLGVKTKYKKLDQKELITLLHRDVLLLISVKLESLYPGKKGYHSILLYDLDENKIHYHDPSYGEKKSISLQALLSASIDTGTALAFERAARSKINR